MWIFFQFLFIILLPILMAKLIANNNEDDFKTIIAVLYGFELVLAILYYAFK